MKRMNNLSATMRDFLEHNRSQFLNLHWRLAFGDSAGLPTNSHLGYC